MMSRNFSERARVFQFKWIYVLASFSIVLLLGFLAFHVLVGAKNSHSVVRLRQKIQQDIPIGSQKKQVIIWLENNQIKYFAVRFTANRNVKPQADVIVDANKANLSDLFARIQRVSFGSYCIYATDVSLAFDEDDKLIWSNVRDNSTCN